MTHSTVTYAPANGLTLAYESFGPEGAPAVLLIAGLGTQMIRWSDGFCGGLAEQGYRVIRYDNRDTGLSTHLDALPAPDFPALVKVLMAGGRPEVPYGIADMAADATGLLDALGIDRAHVVGRSMGGIVAQVLAAEHPERVLSLTSIMSTSGNPALPQADPGVMALMTAPKPDPVSDPDGFLAQSLAFARAIAGTAGFDTEAQAAVVLEETRRAYDPAGGARQLAAMVTAGDRRARLARVVVPTLVLHGADDPLIPPACGADTAGAIPGAELLVLEGMGHDLPEPLHPVILAAIDRTARRAD